MRAILPFLLLLTTSKAKVNISSIEISTQALEDVTYELFDRHGIDFDYVTVGKASHHINDTISGMLTSKPMEKKFKVKQVSSLSQWIGKGALVFFKAWSMLQSILLYDDKFNEASKLLFVVNGKWKKLIANTLSSSGVKGENKISEVFFMIEKDTKYELKVVKYWTENACNQMQLVDVNEFDRKSGKWRQELTVTKDENFYGCTLRIHTSIYPLPALDLINDAGYFFLKLRIQRTIKNRDNKEKEITRILEEKLNFNAIRTSSQFDSNFQTHIMFCDGHCGGHLCSFSWFQHTIKILYSPPECYSNYEKMLLPFDNQTWIYLIIVFCFCFVGIFIINQLPQIIRNLIYGQGINMPSFNVLSIMFGIGQTRLPENNFGRIILMTFILFCLVMRTAYQGVFFEMFTSDMRRPPPETFADLKQRNYTIFNTRSEHFDYNIFAMADVTDRPRMTYIKTFEIFDLFKQMNDSSLKTAIPVTEVDIKTIRGAFMNLPKTLSEEIIYTVSGSCVDKRNFFARANEKILNALISAGIVQYWYRYLLDFEIHALEDTKSEPQVFSIGDLKFGFNVWLVACSVTIVVFVAENCFYHGKRLIKFMVKKFWEFVAMHLLVKFLSMKTFM